MLQIRAKKVKDVRYAVNVDYIGTDTYMDVLNMLCAITQNVVETLNEKEPEGLKILHKSDYYGGIIAVLMHLKERDEKERGADGVQVQ